MGKNSPKQIKYSFMIHKVELTKKANISPFTFTRAKRVTWGIEGKPKNQFGLRV
jgi:hypothetical protein